MAKIIVGDIHIEESCIEELEQIQLELLHYSADKLILLGDYYEKRRPSPKELVFGTELAYNLREHFEKVVLIRGNHDITSDKVSAVDYLKYLDIEIVNDYEEDNIFYGHFFTDKSLFEYGTHTYTIAQLEKYKYVFLGHQHNPQDITDKIFHVGAVRYVNFNESMDRNKRIAILGDKLTWSELSSPIPMKDVTSVGDLKEIDPRTRVRVIFNSFAQFKAELGQLGQYKNKFKELKTKLNFEAITPMQASESKQPNKKLSLQDLIAEELTKIEDQDVRSLLEEQFNDKS